jgi:hypothetical protein
MQNQHREYYTHVYQLQDNAISLLSKQDSCFYLTGGTALSRGYLNHRYSDDLDLFIEYEGMYRPQTEQFISALTEEYGAADVQIISTASNFTRLMVEKDGTPLKIDLVLDRVKRFGDFHDWKGINIDAIENILTNKLGAVLDRDEPRDIVDIICIAQAINFTWSDAVAAAQQKHAFESEELMYRLKTFPVHAIQNVPLIDLPPTREFWQPKIDTLLTDIEKGCENSLHGRNSLSGAREGIQHTNRTDRGSDKGLGL